MLSPFRCHCLSCHCHWSEKWIINVMFHLWIVIIIVYFDYVSILIVNRFPAFIYTSCVRNTEWWMVWCGWFGQYHIAHWNVHLIEFDWSRSKTRKIVSVFGVSIKTEWCPFYRRLDTSNVNYVHWFYSLWQQSTSLAPHSSTSFAWQHVNLSQPHLQIASTFRIYLFSDFQRKLSSNRRWTKFSMK